VSILVVLAGGEMEIELVPATEKSMVFLQSQKLGDHHENAIFCII
jgi:hypothetical protein